MFEIASSGAGDNEGGNRIHYAYTRTGIDLALASQSKPLLRHKLAFTQGNEMRFLLAAMLVMGLGGGSTAHAAPGDDFPNKPVRIVVTVPPGGAADFIARLVGTRLSQELGVPVLVENRAGASGTIAAAFVAKSEPDGYTLLQNSITTHGIGPSLFQKLPYDSFKDLAPVSMLAALPLIMTVNTALPAATIEEFVTLAKGKPGQLSFASSGNGGAPHLAGELFKIAADIDMLHVPYKGSGPAVVDLASGRVQAMFDAAPSLLPHIQSGKLRALAAAGAKRNPLVPNAPTFDERGFKGMQISLWYGMQVPAATPMMVVTRLNAALRKVLDAPDVQQRFAEQGAQAMGNSPEQFAAFMREENQRWGGVIRKARVTLD
jgi:tripartite-type tricarboxylate transporter receptor subunit TctC